jgi:oligoribonuclease NrnB/cAMP/cGMP phosphodiesterase (DHH superfamily)
MKTIIFYHNDLDGLISALGFAYNDYLEKISKSIPDYKELRKYYYFYEVHYGMDNIFEILKKYNIDINKFEKVVIVDYSFSKETMTEFLSVFKENLIWIDHHKNIISEMSDLEINGLTDINFAASVLVWKYFDKEASLFSQYIQDMDIWTWQLPDSKDVLQYLDFLYLQIYDKDTNRDFEINNEFLKLFDNNYFKDCFPIFKEYGKLMNDYINTKVKDDVSTGRTIEFEGVKSFIVNSQFKAGYISEYIFNSELYKDIEMIIVWYRYYAKGEDQKDFDKISLRSRNIDCSQIAKKYGGNGHPKASGFISSDFSKLI